MNQSSHPPTKKTTKVKLPSVVRNKSRSPSPTPGHRFAPKVNQRPNVLYKGTGLGGGGNRSPPRRESRSPSPVNHGIQHGKPSQQRPQTRRKALNLKKPGEDGDELEQRSASDNDNEGKKPDPHKKLQPIAGVDRTDVDFNGRKPLKQRVNDTDEEPQSESEGHDMKKKLNLGMKLEPLAGTGEKTDIRKPKVPGIKGRWDQASEQQAMDEPAIDNDDDPNRLKTVKKAQRQNQDTPADVDNTLGIEPEPEPEPVDDVLGLGDDNKNDNESATLQKKPQKPIDNKDHVQDHNDESVDQKDQTTKKKPKTIEEVPAEEEESVIELAPADNNPARNVLGTEEEEQKKDDQDQADNLDKKRKKTIAGENEMVEAIEGAPAVPLRNAEVDVAEPVVTRQIVKEFFSDIKLTEDGVALIDLSDPNIDPGRAQDLLAVQKEVDMLMSSNETVSVKEAQNLIKSGNEGEPNSLRNVVIKVSPEQQEKLEVQAKKKVASKWPGRIVTGLKLVLLAGTIVMCIIAKDSSGVLKLLAEGLGDTVLDQAGDFVGDVVKDGLKEKLGAADDDSNTHSKIYRSNYPLMRKSSVDKLLERHDGLRFKQYAHYDWQYPADVMEWIEYRKSVEAGEKANVEAAAREKVAQAEKARLDKEKDDKKLADAKKKKQELDAKKQKADEKKRIDEAKKNAGKIAPDRI